MKETIGIIGAGTIVDAFYIPSLLYLGFNRLSLFDIDTKQALRLAEKHRIKTIELSGLIESSSTLIIATPPHTHFELLKQCIIAGNKTVICEKPFLFAQKEAEEMMALSQKYHSIVLVAHLRRCFTAIELAKNTIPTLTLGKLQKASIWEGGRFSYKPKSDYTTHNSYGGVLLDTGSHALDCFLYATGLTRQISTCTIHTVKKDKPEPAHEVFYAFDIDGIAVNLTLSRYQALSNKISLYYENGIVEIPLGLKPNIAVTQKGKRNIYSAQEKCYNYMSEVFKAELDQMLIQKKYTLFEAADFIQLTGLLESLYKA
jgi:predicted dehydrogenase